MMLLGPAKIKVKPLHEFIKLFLPTLVRPFFMGYTGLTKEHGPRFPKKFKCGNYSFRGAGLCSLLIYKVPNGDSSVILFPLKSRFFRLVNRRSESTDVRSFTLKLSVLELIRFGGYNEAWFSCCFF
jgi:hypothetical protein